MAARRQPVVPLSTGLADVRLRPWVSEDAPALLILRRDPLVRRYSGRLIDTRGEALASMTRWSSGWQDATGAGWAIVGHGDQLLGLVSFGLQDREILTGSVGYELAPEARGYGIASAAVRAGTSQVFSRFGWHRIELYHSVENEASCGVARRSGYVYEGVMRSAMRYPSDGRRSDEHLHARIITDDEPGRRGR